MRRRSQYSKEKRDAILLAIKDIKEALDEVKTGTIRSPYTAEKPKEPIWVMRWDVSPTRDCGDQRPVDGDAQMTILTTEDTLRLFVGLPALLDQELLGHRQGSGLSQTLSALPC